MSRPSEQGVGLMELVIVLFIGMVMVALAFPQIRTSLRNYTLTGATREVTRMVQLARYKAITQGANACTLVAGNLFGVDTNCNGTLDTDETVIALPTGVTLTATNPEGGTPIFTGMNFSTTPVAVASPFVVTFTPRGSATAAPAVEILYLTSWGSYCAVTVLGAGRARSWQYDGTSWR